MKLLSFLEKKRATWFLIISSFIFFLLRLPSLFEPYWYGDEGIYTTIGYALSQGKHLYTQVWDNKPPLFYWIYGVFAGDQQLVRIFSLLIGIATTIAFYFLSEKILKKQKAAFIATVFFGFFFATPFLEGNIANAENFMLLPIILGALLIVRCIQNLEPPIPTPTSRPLFLAGILLGTATLIKIVAVFDFAAFFFILYIILQKNSNNFLKILQYLVTFFIGFLIPLTLATLLFTVQGSFSIFVRAILLSNISYVSYGNYFLFPNALLFLKLLLLCGLLLLLWKKSSLLPFRTMFIFSWLGFALFDMFFSQRTYIHYALVILPVISLFIGNIFVEKKQWYTVPIIGILCVGLLIALPYRFGRMTLSYYGNFLGFITGIRNADTYYTFFDTHVRRDTKLVSFINSHKNAKTTLFVWGDNAQLYRLTNTTPPSRFMVLYHMTSIPGALTETLKTLAKNPPTYIIVIAQKPLLPYPLQNYQQRLTTQGATIYEKVF